MSNLPRILCASIATLAIGAPVLKAATIDTFEAENPRPIAIAGQHGTGAGLSIPSEEENTFLRLTSGVNSQNNSYTYNRVDEGAFEKTVATFDFRVLPGDNGLADGIGFLLLPTSAYGVSGVGPVPTAEEPNVAGAFGLGIDVYDNINNISTHFNGAQMTEMNPAPNVSFRDNGVFNRVQIELSRVGNGSHAIVTVTPDSLGEAPGAPYKIFETLIPNMLPYEYRAQFLGRTGGQNAILDVDNLNVTSTVPFDPGSVPQAPAETAGHLYQDFDSTGTTFYRAIQVANTNEVIFRPGPLIKTVEENNTSDGNFLRLVNDGTEGNNRIIFNRARDSGASNATEVLEFDLRFNSADLPPADGLGLLFVPTIDPISGADITNGGGVDSSEEPGHLGMLGVGFDIYPNGDPDIAPGVSLHYDGNLLRDVALPEEFALGSFHKVQVIRESVANGLNVSVIAIPNTNGTPGAPITLIDKHFVEGARNYDHRVQFTGRTGGSNADHDLDNIRSSQIGRAASATTRATFANVLEAPYKAYGLVDGAGPRVMNDGFETPNGDFLRLIHDNSNGQSNTINFDKQLDGSIAGATSIKGEFAFRTISTDNPADGFAMMLTPTSIYGDSGVGAATAANFAAEKPNVQGVFGIGFDLYDNAGQPYSEITAHWDGVQSGAFLLEDVLTNNPVFNKVRFELTPFDGGTLLDLFLVPDNYAITPGQEIAVFENLEIFGMDLYDYRVEFAGRTGGLNMTVDLDDILVQTVPEPGSAALLAVGGVFMGCFRRSRRKTLA